MTYLNEFNILFFEYTYVIFLRSVNILFDRQTNHFQYAFKIYCAREYSVYVHLYGFIFIGYSRAFIQML